MSMGSMEIPSDLKSKEKAHPTEVDKRQDEYPTTKEDR